VLCDHAIPPRSIGGVGEHVERDPQENGAKRGRQVTKDRSASKKRKTIPQSDKEST